MGKRRKNMRGVGGVGFTRYYQYIIINQEAHRKPTKSGSGRLGSYGIVYPLGFYGGEGGRLVIQKLS